MSAQKPTRRKTVADILSMKGKAKIVSLTAYTAPLARLLDPHVDILMVGDSLGMVVYGFDSTLPVTLELMIPHGRAVVSHSSLAHVVVDLPFGSYQESPEQAYRSAARLLKEAGCGSVKMEGGVEMASTIAFLTERGIPVMAHIGLQPQSVNQIGGYKYQGKSLEDAKSLLADAKAVEKAGAYAVVIEATVDSVAQSITKQLRIPTIGIGASTSCDGQVLVIDDMLGMSSLSPRFAKRYSNLDTAISKAAEQYSAEVRAKKFPGKEHLFTGKP
jgi:3-methyl-2-oxobutanoate hydroxymethyltransferase